MLIRRIWTDKDKENNAVWRRGWQISYRDSIFNVYYLHSPDSVAKAIEIFIQRLVENSKKLQEKDNMKLSLTVYDM